MNTSCITSTCNTDQCLVTNLDFWIRVLSSIEAVTGHEGAKYGMVYIQYKDIFTGSFDVVVPFQTLKRLLDSR